MKHVVVIGAGITGITTAYELLEHGMAVTVCDRHQDAALETSYANAGHISASDAELWTNWSTVLAGLRWALRADAPLRLNPRPTWHKLSWLAEFLASIGNYRSNTIETIGLAVKARMALFEIADREGIDFDLRRGGVLHFYRSENELARARIVNDMFAEAGLEQREVSANDIAALEPGLVGDTAGGFFSEGDASGDAHKFTMGLAGVCARRGADLRFGADVSKVETSGQVCG